MAKNATAAWCVCNRTFFALRWRRHHPQRTCTGKSEHRLRACVWRRSARVPLLWDDCVRGRGKHSNRERIRMAFWSVSPHHASPPSSAHTAAQAHVAARMGVYYVDAHALPAYVERDPFAVPVGGRRASSE